MAPVGAHEGEAASRLPAAGELPGAREETQQLVANTASSVSPQDRSSPCPPAFPGPGDGSPPLPTKATSRAQQLLGCSRMKAAVSGLFSSKILIAGTVAIVSLVLFLIIFPFVRPYSHKENPISLPFEPCPEDWLYFKRKCYYLSEDEKDWESSQSFCSQYEASLAVIENDKEMHFLTKRMHMQDSWIGLRKQEDGFYWVNGTPFTTDLCPIQDHEECAYTDSSSISTSACSLPRRWICSCRPQSEQCKGIFNNQKWARGLSSLQKGGASSTTTPPNNVDHA